MARSFARSATVDPDRVSRLIAVSRDLCRDTRHLLRRSRVTMRRYHGLPPPLRVVGGAAGPPSRQRTTRSLFAMADLVEESVREWHDAPARVREPVESNLYEAAELIRKAARAAAPGEP